MVTPILALTCVCCDTDIPSAYCRQGTYINMLQIIDVMQTYRQTGMLGWSI